ncbi:beta strand repeat-containing protein, partial [Methylobacterium sp. Leaf94]|uniref:beta strand repeat-containing protein n=1 Tax=Methylobacterium sp. Leaf94 TaxID=1736250 RepID=UPI003FD37AF3
MVGNGATDNGAINATVLGNGASVAAGLAGSNVAIGQGSTVSAAAVPVAGATIGGTAYTFAGATPAGAVSFGAVGTERQLQNVAAGRLTATSTDAVNGSQLFATNQAVTAVGAQSSALGTSVANNLGGGSTYDPAAGTVSAPTYNVYGSPQTNVGSAITALQTGAPVQYSTAAGVPTPQTPSNNVTLVGAAAGPVTLHNVAAGTAATDAVNVSQLAGAIAANDFPVRSGDAGPFTTTATGVGSLAVGSNAIASAGSTVVGNGATDNGAANATVLGNGASVAAGLAGSSVAIGQGSTVSAAAVPVAGATIGGTAYTFAGGTPAGVVSVGGVGTERQIQNVAAGRLTTTSTDAVNGSQLAATNTQVTANTTAITTVGGRTDALGTSVATNL